jgi:hypothetical protein
MRFAAVLFSNSQFAQWKLLGILSGFVAPIPVRGILALGFLTPDWIRMKTHGQVSLQGVE